MRSLRQTLQEFERPEISQVALSTLQPGTPAQRWQGLLNWNNWLDANPESWRRFRSWSPYRSWHGLRRTDDALELDSNTGGKGFRLPY
jgi:hypothetical protein